MVENSQTTGDEREGEDAATAAPAAPRRPSGHRGTDVRDTVAEMTARAQEISMEAGSKIATAMKDVINAAAGLTGFAVESARDLVQYMIRRGQMSQEEADRLMHDVEAAHVRFGGNPRPAPGAAAEPTASAEPATTRAAAPAEPAGRTPAAKAPAATAPTAKAPAAKAAGKGAAKAPSKAAAKPASKGAAKAPARPAAKAAPKAAAKKAAPAGRAKAAKPPARSAASKGAAKGKKK